MIYSESCDLVLIGCAYMPCQYHSDKIQGSGVAASSKTSLRSTSIIRFISHCYSLDLRSNVPSPGQHRP